MMKNVLEYLEASAAAFPDKTAVIDDVRSLTYGELLEHARQIGQNLIRAGLQPGEPAALLMRKSVTALELFFGIVYAGGFYTLIDPGFPQTRMVGTPGAQGISANGAHGAGVNTPAFAAVAAMTAGLFGQLHIPKVGSLLSMIVATLAFMPCTVC